jgi:hypothetical protein
VTFLVDALTPLSLSSALSPNISSSSFTVGFLIGQLTEAFKTP